MSVKRLPAVRERTEELERASMSSWATLAVETKGRDTYEDPDPLRTAFQCDRDRILHSSAFRRLKHKTHLSLGDGHRRVRATHTLEVAQVARTIGRALRLNEDLIEAIALGHDLGNTAFGGAGEEALSTFTPVPFRHEVQSLRVVEQLEKGGQGLNLTWEVRDGIVNHRPDGPTAGTLEGQTVRVADAITSVTYDLYGACRYGLLHEQMLPVEITATLGVTHSERLSTMIHDVVAESADQAELRLTPRVEEAHHNLQALLRSALAASGDIAAERTRAVHCLSSIAVYLLQNPESLPDTPEDVVTRMCDVISSHTDGQALSTFKDLFLPSV
ncbi:MAG: HD domain-containing protein [Nitriliruptorales bacterium]|nr:HD domain-containing protein [Nitriliruptorales bacterium]